MSRHKAETGVTKRDEALALSNTGLAPPEIAFALMQRAGTAALDGLHNLTDGLAYWRQLRAIKRRWLEPTVRMPAHRAKTEQERKNTYRMMAWPAVGSAVLSAYGVAESVVVERSTELDAGHVGTTAASLAIAGLLTATGSRLKRQLKPGASPELRKDVTDFHDHAKLDAASSAIAVAGAGLHAVGLGAVEQVAGLGIAAYQAKRFWPSEKNLQRGLQRRETPGAGHGHNHHDGHDHVHVSDMWEASKRGARRAVALGRAALGKLIPTAGNERQPARRHWRVAAMAGLAAVVLTGGIGGHPDEHVEARPSAPGVASQNEVPPAPPQPAPRRSLFAEQCIGVGLGNSQWHIVESQLERATGAQPDVSLVSAATMFTAHENLAEIPNPHAVSPDDCIVVPSDVALQAMHQAADMPASPLGQALNVLNRHNSWEQGVADTAAHRQIAAQLEAAVAE